MPEAENAPGKSGSLTIVGTGIAVGQVTAQALGVLADADIVLTVIGEPVMMAYLAGICRRVEDLIPTYRLGKPRIETYDEMTQRVMICVRAGLRVCFALYGHPGVLAFPAHTALRAARAEGYPAEMLPGVSAEACLLADLDIDPGDEGLQSYEACRFLQGKLWDPGTPLVLWQVGAVGDHEYRHQYPNRRLGELIDKLVATYGPAHGAAIYEAATLPMQEPRVDRLPLAALASARLTTASTLFVPPIDKARSESGTLG